MQWGQAPGLDAYQIGETYGLSQVTLSESQIPSHDHIITGVRDSGSSGTADPSLYMGVDRPAAGENISYLSDTASNTLLSNSALGMAGGSDPHNNMQPFLTLNYCIALDGIYPPRS